MKVAAFLPAKGTSDRIENKNLRLLDGKPLFLHTLEKLMACDFLDEVWLDTDSPAMAQMASHTGCRLLMRDPRLATNKTDGHQLFLNEVAHTQADVVLQILCTSPFIKIDTLRQAVDALRQSHEHDSVVLVRSDRFYFWRDGQPAYNLAHIPNSVDLPTTTFETMGLYVMRREAALRTQRRIGDKPLALPATPLEAVDLNWPEDMELADLIAAGHREKERKLHHNLSRLLNSSLLSDLLDDAGYPRQVIRQCKTHLSSTRVLGRAKTLRLRALREGEDFKGIYEALRSYDTVVPGDVIMVENEVPDFAYFGELNANLALRSGAVAAVVGGVTRDAADVMRLGFPVFARGYGCQDVRKRATVDHMNQPIHIEGIAVRPGDLVFCDNEGIVVIPAALERQIIDKALHSASNEKHLLADIAQGIEVAALTEKYGFF